MVRGAGLEPARYFYHEPLKLACLPFHHPRTDSGSLKARPRSLFPQRPYGPDFGTIGLAWFAGAGGITGAVIGAGFAGGSGITGLVGATTLRLTARPDPKILPVKRRVEA
jgi:hypothetical protein